MTDIIYKTDSDEHRINTGETPDPALIDFMHNDPFCPDDFNDQVKADDDWRAYEEGVLNHVDFR